MCVLGPVLGSGRDPGTPLWSQAVKQGTVGGWRVPWGRCRRPSLHELSGFSGLCPWTGLSFLLARWPQSSGVRAWPSWAPARGSCREVEAPWPFGTQPWKSQSVTSTANLPQACPGSGEGT